MLHNEGKQGSPIYQTTLTRLSDGAYWILTAPPGYTLGSTLYVDAEELAVMEGSGTDVFVDAGQVAGESWSILRRSIASLGPPTLPDAGM